jgi:hypothetical protein
MHLAFEFPFEIDDPRGEAAPFNEREAGALAAELLTLSTTAELDHFLGKVFRKAGTGGPALRALGQGLRLVGRAALPAMRGGAPSVGPLGPIVEGVVGDGEVQGELGDHAFDVARRFVQLAGRSARDHAVAPPRASSPATHAVATMTGSARRLGLVRGF